MANDERTFGIRAVKHNGDVYLNSSDMIDAITNHSKAVIGTGKLTGKLSPTKEGYKLAHDHLIEIITVEKSFAERWRS